MSNPLRKHIKGAQKFEALPGVYRGKVMKINDSNKLGFVKVMVYGVHENFDNVDELPDAYVSQMFGGGRNYGTMIIPPVGSTVFVMFECGNPRNPIIIGTWSGVQEIVENGEIIGEVNEVPSGVKNTLIKHEMNNQLESDIIVEREIQESEIYSSDDNMNENYRKEDRCYRFKSPKGNIIEIDDTGYGDNNAVPENRAQNQGIRITTTRGQVIHIIDEPGKEQIIIKNANTYDPVTGEIVPGNYIQLDEVNKTINILSNKDIKKEIKNDELIHVNHDKKVKVDNNQIETVGVDWTINVGGNINISAVNGCNIIGGGAINVESSGSEINIKSMNGKIKIESVNDPVEIKGSRIDLN